MPGDSYRTDCDECSEEIPASARFCPRCGDRQPWFTDDDRAQMTILAKVVLGMLLAILAVFGVATTLVIL